MRIRLLNVFLLTALVFAVSRLWLFLGQPPLALPAITSGTTLPAVAGTEVEQNAESEQLRPEIYDVIVARDLFSTTRGVVPPVPVVANKQPAKPQPVPKLTLSGVVIIGEEKAAYLQEGTQDGRPRKVRENENFAGGVVKTIRTDGISFLFAGTEINVPLRTPKEGAVAAPTTPRGQAPGNASPPRPQAPAAFPRRMTPPGLQPGQLPVPGRPATTTPGMPAIAPPAMPGGEVIEEEEFPEESFPDADELGLTEEEPGN